MAKVEGHHVGGLAFLLFLIAAAVLGISGWAADGAIVGSDLGGSNGATVFVIIFSLIAGLMTGAASIAGLFHFKASKAGSLAAASALAILAWLFSITALGFGSKQIKLGGTGKTLTALAALDIVMGFFSTVYLLALHGGLVNSSYGQGY